MKILSVCMITYNHERYIRKAIAGVIMQKTNFKIELVVGEDFSTDATRTLCQEYAERYPELIRLLPTEKNLGMTQNLLRTFNACAGKYIAICEGDDYWTDPCKLQKQVDFLEANPEYSAACHQTEKIIENSPREKELYFQFSKNILTKKDLIRSTSIHTNSIVFRKEALLKYDLKTAKHLVEHALYILIVQSGNFRVFPEVMSVYRRHDQGRTGVSTPEKAYLGQIAWMTEVRDILGWKFFWGYHFLTSKVHSYYALNYPEVFKGGFHKRNYFYFKYAVLILLLYPRSMKTIFRLLPKITRFTGK